MSHPMAHLDRWTVVVNLVCAAVFGFLTGGSIALTAADVIQCALAWVGVK